MELVEDDTGGFVAVRPRLRDHIAAHLHADRIDRKLADGGLPEDSVAAALRGRTLTGPRARRRLACGLDRAIATASGRRTPFSVLDSAQIQRALTELSELRARLDRDTVPSARGMARARLLLVDGTGPLYNPNAARDVRDSVRAVLDAFAAR
jgi:hypothetical protein